MVRPQHGTVVLKGLPRAKKIQVSGPSTIYRLSALGFAPSTDGILQGHVFTYIGAKKKKKFEKSKYRKKNSKLIYLRAWCDNSTACSTGCERYLDKYKVFIKKLLTSGNKSRWVRGLKRAAKIAENSATAPTTITGGHADKNQNMACDHEGKYCTCFSGTS